MQKGYQAEIKNRMANNVDPDDDFYEPSQLDLQCLHRYLFLSAVLKRLKEIN